MKEVILGTGLIITCGIFLSTLYIVGEAIFFFLTIATFILGLLYLLLGFGVISPKNNNSDLPEIDEIENK